jgi:NAD-dependent deacetylase
MTKKKITVLTGAGMSAESGISTFRDADGLWEQHDIMDVASIEGWNKNPHLVLNFYNQRRQQLKTVEPNAGHYALVELENYYDVSIVTQNVDDLHERAGSSNIIHLHGELRKVRSTRYEHLIYPWEDDLNWGDLCEKGQQLRPHIVWFGELVPKINEGAHAVTQSDVVIIIGTSMQVYPAAGLVDFAPEHTDIYYVDPKPSLSQDLYPEVKIIAEKATTGVRTLVDQLIAKA